MTQSLVDESRRVRPTGRGPNPTEWQSELRNAIRDPGVLVETLGLDPRLALDAAEAGFPTLAPRPFVRRMRRGDPNDPLLLQVLPRAEEGESEGLPIDAVGDLAASPVDGLIKKYEGRALLMASPACAVHCRYCFRRHYPYDRIGHGDAAWDEPLARVAADHSISEIILSGGDPLTLGDDRLHRLVGRIDAISHIRRIRLHTRLPVVIPSRVTDALMRILRETRATWIIVLHANHANELDEDVATAAERMRSTGALLLNQTVLLRSVNDSVSALRNLGERLIEIGVAPYYLHALDKVAGVAHFELGDNFGSQLITDLRSVASGYVVPRFVREHAGESSKRLLQ